MKNRYPILLLCCLLLSCDKDPLVPNDDNDNFWDYECPYGKEFTDINNTSLTQNGIIPLNFNNYWIYVDTNWNENGYVTSITIDTVRLTKISETNSDIWWSFNQILPSIHQKEDTTYILETTFPHGCFNKRLEYYPLGNDTVISWRVIEGDIMVELKTYKINDTIYTPAGFFDQCSYYEYNWSHLPATTLKEGIGVINLSYFNVIGNKIRELTLIEYYLE